jgi:hypothetical protein
MHVVRLAPNQIETLATAICGGEGTPVEYRSWEKIVRFRAFVDADIEEYEEGGSRWKDTVRYLGACNNTPAGKSGLPRAIEKVILALVDRRQFTTDWVQHEVAAFVRSSVLGRVPVAVEIDLRGEASLRSTTTGPGQEIIDQEIHTVFEEVLTEGSLKAARSYYAKARRLLGGAEPDYANAAKEAFLSIESLVRTLTGEKDFNKAIAKAVNADLIPKPLGELIKKLHAYRGDEAGVAHAGDEEPDVDHHDAQFVVNLAAVIGAYLRAKLVAGSSPGS